MLRGQVERLLGLVMWLRKLEGTVEVADGFAFGEDVIVVLGEGDAGL